jgi:hypothetical protein
LLCPGNEGCRNESGRYTKERIHSGGTTGRKFISETIKKESESIVNKSNKGSYVLPKEDELLINRILARIDRAIDIYEKIGNIEEQRFEMEIRESMQRVVSRGEQQNVMKQLLPLLGNIGKPTLKTKGKKITKKDKRL